LDSGDLARKTPKRSPVISFRKTALLKTPGERGKGGGRGRGGGGRGGGEGGDRGGMRGDKEGKVKTWER